jgi:hypothetical protein
MACLTPNFKYFLFLGQLKKVLLVDFHLKEVRRVRVGHVLLLTDVLLPDLRQVLALVQPFDRSFQALQTQN